MAKEINLLTGVVKTKPDKKIDIPDTDKRVFLTQQINAWRSTEEVSGISYMGHLWDTDEQARSRILSTLQAGIMPLPYWTSAANVDVPMTYANIQGLWSAIVTRGGEIHARQREMKKEIASLTGNQLENYKVGWK